jgi:HEAT repeat protein
MARRFDDLLEHLSTHLRNSDDDHEKIAELGLKKIENPSRKHIELVQGLLTHRNDLLILDAITALAYWRRRGSLSTIVRLCSGHREELVRQAVVEAIWDLKGLAFRKTLETMLKDESRLVRMWAVDAYAALFRDDKAARTLRRISLSERRFNVRVSLYWNLYALGRREYLDAFLSLLNHRRFLIRRLACRSLYQRENIYLPKKDRMRITEHAERRLQKETEESVRRESQKAIDSLQF